MEIIVIIIIWNEAECERCSVPILFDLEPPPEIRNVAVVVLAVRKALPF